MINGNESDYVRVISGVPQGTVLGPLMYLLYINDISENISSSPFVYLQMTVLYTDQSVTMTIPPYCRKTLLKFQTGHIYGR